MKSSASLKLHPKIGDEVQHLRLNRDVERGHRLVGDDEARVGDNRARNTDALPLTSRELVRIAIVVGRVEAYTFHDLVHPHPLLAGRSEPVRTQWTGDDRSDPTTRVQGGVRILEDDLDIPS